MANTNSMRHQFNGKRFDLMSITRTKRTAVSEAKKLRRKGSNARVTRTPKTKWVGWGYCVWGYDTKYRGGKRYARRRR